MLLPDQNDMYCRLDFDCEILMIASVDKCYTVSLWICVLEPVEQYIPCMESDSCPYHLHNHVTGDESIVDIVAANH